MEKNLASLLCSFKSLYFLVTTSWISESTLQPVRKYLYQDIAELTYLQQFCAKQSSAGNIKHIVFVNNHIWLLDKKRNINIYNKNCKKVKFIRNEREELNYSERLVYSPSGFVLVLCPKNRVVKGGIHMILTTGDYVKRLTDKVFDNICTHNNKFYALAKLTLHTALIEDNVWMEIDVIKLNLELEVFSTHSALYCSKQGLFISHYFNIYHLAHNGTLLHKFGRKSRKRYTPGLPGYFRSISVFGVDEAGNVMVANRESSIIQLYNSKTKKWEVLNLDIINIIVNDFIPDHILFDVESGNIWIASHKNTNRHMNWMVTKYTKI